MALNIGDKVKFLNEEGGGKITELIDKDTVMVLSDVDDFEIPMLITELVVVGKEQSTANSELFVEDKKVAAKKRREGAFFLFVENKNECECFLYNGEASALVFGVFEEQKEMILGLKSGIVQSGAVEKLATYSLKELETISQWRVQGFYFEKKPKEITTPLDCVIKMHPKKFLTGNAEFVEELGKEAVAIPLVQKTKTVELTAEDFFAEQPKDTKTALKKQPKRQNTHEVLEVDLHIHELLETTSGMSNGEMLEYQMDTFRKVLDENKKYKGKRIVFIHGVGNGVLKQRIRHELQKYPRYMVQDASFQEYGWGATMVIVK